MPKKPHIIIFNPDEMRWDGMGHMANPAAYTPNLDAFAQNEAVSFSNAYCQNPVCVPSRCSFLTGLYPHVRGHRTMSHLLHEDETSLFRELKEAGYYVWMNGRNDLAAGQLPGNVESHADEIFYFDPGEPVAPARNDRPRPKDSTAERYPYSHYEGVREQAGDSDSRDVNAAVNRILNPVSDKPLCLFLGLLNPHPPYGVEPKYYNKIKKELLSARVRAEETENKSLILDSIRGNLHMEGFTEEQWTELRAVYLAQCAKIDDLFGRLCNALKQAGMYDDCAIFVLSDHGDFAGDYGLPEKAQNSFEDCLCRVPLLIKPPKSQPVDPGTAEGLVELVDFYASVMDYAEVEPDHDHFGRSLRGMIENRRAEVRDYVCCEGGRLPGELQADECHESGKVTLNPGSPYWPKQKAQSDPLAHEKGTMIRTKRYKYIERPSGRNELYDLQDDPGERRNIYEREKDSQEVLKLRLELLKWYQTTCDTVPRKADSRFAPEKIWSMVRSSCPPESERAVRERIEQGGDFMEILQDVAALSKN